MKKRHLLFFLAPAFAFAGALWNMVSVSAETNEEADAPTIVVEQSYAKVGSYATVDLSIENNSGIAGALIAVSYDSDLTLVDSSVGEALSSLDFTPPKRFDNPCNFLWDTENIEANEDGVFLTLNFLVSETAVVGENLAVEVSYRYGDIFDLDQNSLSVEVVNGYIEVLDYTPGDVNDDGVVNSKDILLVRRYIAGGYDESINENAADVNDDGVINSKDIMTIRRYIAGGYGVKLLPHHEVCQHTLEAIAYKAATCTEAGNIAYWHCTTCGKYFGDENAEREISLEDAVIPATGHAYGAPVYTWSADGKSCVATATCANDLSHQITEQAVVASSVTKEATCEEKGQTTYVAMFAEGKFSMQIKTVEDIVAKGHTVVTDAAVAPTTTSAGLTEGSHCAVCNKILTPQQVIPMLNAIVYNDTRNAENGNPDSYSTGDGVDFLVDLPDTDGYTFVGWYTARTGGEAVSYIPASSEGKVVLFARWKAIEYTVTYHLTYGRATATNSSQNPTTFTVEDEIRLEAPTLSRYAFDGWTDENGDIVTSIPKGTTENVDLTANWITVRDYAHSYENTSELYSVIQNGSEYSFVYYLGYLDNVVLNAGNAYLHEGENRTITAEVSETSTDTIAMSASNTTTHTTSWQGKVSSSIGASVEGISAIVSAELSKSESFSNSAVLGISVGSAKQNVDKNTDTRVFSSADPKGYYRYVVIGTLEVYAVVTYNINTGEYSVGNFEYVKNIGYNWDYSALSSSFTEDRTASDLPFDLPVEDVKESVEALKVEYAETYNIPLSELDSYTFVSNLEEFGAIGKNPSGNYILISDIDMSGVTWTPIPSFSGTIDGYGHTISNLTLTVNNGDGSTSYYGLIGQNQGTVQNLVLDGFKIDITKNADGLESLCVGALCGLNSGTLSGVVVKNAMITVTHYQELDDLEKINKAQAGGICGVCYGGTITQCLVAYSTIFGKADLGENNGDAHINVGGITGELCLNATLTYSIVRNTRLTAIACGGASNNNGLIGEEDKAYLIVRNGCLVGYAGGAATVIDHCMEFGNTITATTQQAGSDPLRSGSGTETGCAAGRFDGGSLTNTVITGANYVGAGSPSMSNNVMGTQADVFNAMADYYAYGWILDDSGLPTR